MSNNVITCECVATGSVDFHQDSRPTLVMVNNVLYDLVPSPLSFKDVLAMDPKTVPHVRHLNRIPMRTQAQQEVENKNMIGYLKNVSKDTPATPIKSVQKVRAAKAVEHKEVLSKSNNNTPKSGGSNMAGSKIKQVEEALKQKALTMDEMVAMGISKATVSVRLCALKKAGYDVVKAEVDGKMTYKVNGQPKA